MDGEKKGRHTPESEIEVCKGLIWLPDLSLGEQTTHDFRDAVEDGQDGAQLLLVLGGPEGSGGRLGSIAQA